MTSRSARTSRTHQILVITSSDQFVTDIYVCMYLSIYNDDDDGNNNNNNNNNEGV